jgi:uncharacterized protein (DUF885 family)
MRSHSTRGTPRATSFFALVTAALLLLVGATAYAGEEETRRLHDWLDGQFEEELQSSPEQLTTMGRKDRYGELDDYSAEGQEKELARLRESVAAMRQRFDRDALTEEGRTSYDYWEYRLQRAEDAHAFSDHQYAFSQISALHTSLPNLLINHHRVDTLEDMQAYISRLEAAGTAMRQNLSRAKAAADKGIRAPRFAYDIVIKQAQDVISGAPFSADEPSSLWTDALNKIEALRQASVVDASTAERLKSETREALTGPFRDGYIAVIDWMRSDRSNTSEQAQGAHALPRGKEYYAERLRYNTTTALSAEEIHQLGLNEVARIKEAMQAVMAETGFEGTLQDFFSYVRDDDRFYYPDSESGRSDYIEDTREYLDAIESQLPDFFGRLPKAELEVRRVEPYRERDGGAAHYVKGTSDGSRPGVYYLHLSDMRANNLTDLQTTAYHEGNPGHHMQISIAQENDALPEFRRHLWASAYGEGWALYAEQVAAEMGLVTDPYNEFGRLTAEIFRAIRLVVDSGLHHYGWSEEEAVEYMLANSALPEAKVRSEIRRYIAWPGQATSYKVGMLRLLALRESARDVLGDDFDIRGFHDTVLGGGSLPLPLLETRLANWVEEQRGQSSP